MNASILSVALSLSVLVAAALPAPADAAEPARPLRDQASPARSRSRWTRATSFRTRCTARGSFPAIRPRPPRRAPPPGSRWNSISTATRGHPQGRDRDSCHLHQGQHRARAAAQRQRPGRGRADQRELQGRLIRPSVPLPRQRLRAARCRSWRLAPGPARGARPRLPPRAGALFCPRSGARATAMPGNHARRHRGWLDGISEPESGALPRINNAYRTPQTTRPAVRALCVMGDQEVNLTR